MVGRNIQPTEIATLLPESLSRWIIIKRMYHQRRLSQVEKKKEEERANCDCASQTCYSAVSSSHWEDAYWRNAQAVEPGSFELGCLAVQPCSEGYPSDTRLAWRLLECDHCSLEKASGLDGSRGTRALSSAVLWRRRTSGRPGVAPVHCKADPVLPLRPPSFPTLSTWPLSKVRSLLPFGLPPISTNKVSFPYSSLSPINYQSLA